MRQLNAEGTDRSATPSSGAVAAWTGRAISGIVIAFLALDGVIKLVPLEVVTDTLAGLGYPPEHARLIGVITLGAALLYAWPRTAFLGAILLTGLLGGAIATHLRVGSPLFSHQLFGLYVGVLAWLGLWLRDHRVRDLVPITNDKSPHDA